MTHVPIKFDRNFSNNTEGLHPLAYIIEMKDSKEDANHTGRPSVALTWAGVWSIGVIVVCFLEGVARVSVIAMEPIDRHEDRIGIWIAYVLSILFLFYFEGYIGFQKKLSPLVVRRALCLYCSPCSSSQMNERQVACGGTWWHIVLGPFFVLGMFHATTRHFCRIWILTAFIVGLIICVMHLPYPYRSVIDAGVVVGLGWGTLSIAVLYLIALYKRELPDVDPCFPLDSPYPQYEGGTKEEGERTDEEGNNSSDVDGLTPVRSPLLGNSDQV